MKGILIEYAERIHNEEKSYFSVPHLQAKEEDVFSYRPHSSLSEASASARASTTATTARASTTATTARASTTATTATTARMPLPTYPYKAVFEEGQRGHQLLIDPYNVRMVKSATTPSTGKVHYRFVIIFNSFFLPLHT